MEPTTPNLALGDRVCSKTDRATIGTVVELWSTPKGMRHATVRWPDPRRLGGSGYRCSNIAVASLIKVDGEVA